MNNLTENVSKISNQASKAVENIGTNITQGLENVQKSVSNTLNEFSSSSNVTANRDFLSSNSIVAKFVFLILVIIAFFFLVNLGVKTINYFSQSSNKTNLIQGVLNGNKRVVISQNPKISKNIVYRSNNEKTGLEATWSVWLYIDSGSPSKTYSHIFHKGNSQMNTDNIANVNNAPGVYVKQNLDGTATIRVYMDTVESNNVYLDVNNIPLLKWFHLVIRIQNNTMDVYMNGIVSNKIVFNNTVKQNYDNVYVGKINQNYGFDGKLSNLTYYDYAISIFEINNLLLRGPNLKLSDQERENVGYYSYLSSLWYLNN